MINDCPELAVTQALARLGGNEKIYVMLLNKFQESYTDSAEKYESMIESGSFTEACMLAHSIKGVAANLGAGPLCDTANKLEQALKQKSAEDAIKALPGYREALSGLLGIIREAG